MLPTKIFSALALMIPLGLAEPPKEITIHVVSKEGWKGGNCLGIQFDVRYAYVCSDPKDKIYNDIHPTIRIRTRDTLTYRIGFSNQCHLSYASVSDITFQWAQISSAEDVYFRDDQCFWSTEDDGPNGNSIASTEREDHSGYKILDSKGTALCLDDQKRLNPPKMKINPFYLMQPSNSNISNKPESAQPWPSSKTCADEDSAFPEPGNEVTQGPIADSGSPVIQQDSVGTGTGTEIYEANAALGGSTLNPDSVFDEDVNLNLRHRSKRGVLPRQFIV